MNPSRHLIGIATGLLIAGAALAPATVSASNGHSVKKAAAATAPSFLNFELSGTAGVTCPNTAGTCTNQAAEPAIRSDRAGNFYGSSENSLLLGTDAFKSTDGGHHYRTLPSPDAGSSANTTGFAPGGGDTDLATAPVKNAAGFYNVYVASLSLANIDVSTSTNGGASWSLNPVSATISGDDREWIAADGSSKVCISYHDLATFNIDVNCSSNAGLTFTQLGDAIDVNHAWLINNNQGGNLAIDPATHIVYDVFDGIANATEVPCSEAGTCGFHAMWVAVSTNGGVSFTDHLVYVNPNTTVSLNHNFPNLAIDRAGNLYAAWSDNHNIFYSFSTTHGSSWSAPHQVNKAPSATAIFPWIAAGANGKIDVVYYGTGYYDGVNPPDNYPSSAAWYAYMAQDLSATSATSSFTQVAATPVVHFGGVCEGGVTCSGNRDLYDDFGVAADPLNGLASIIYSDDQYTNDATNPPGGYSCPPSSSNSGGCDHTSVATQTSGTGIY